MASAEVSDVAVAAVAATAGAPHEDLPVPPPHPDEVDENLQADFEDDLDGMMDDLLYGEDGATADTVGNTGSDMDHQDRHDDTSSPLPTMLMAATLTHSPDSPDPWRLANAVHMELQENAKLPTFHWTVDRSGSAVVTLGANKIHKDRTESTGSVGDAGNGIPHSNSSTNLMELFLSSESRASQQSNYANRHRSSSVEYALPTLPFLEGNESALPVPAPTPTTDDMNVDLDPTPLSEIKRRIARHQAKQEHDMEKTTAVAAGAIPNGSTNGTITNSSPFRPQRQHPLPIPTTTKQSMVTATAPTPKTDPVPLKVSLSVPATPTTTAVKTSVVAMTTTRAAPAVEALVPKSPPSKHAAAHAFVKPALQTASQKQSQYGFGRKHVVPSIPAASRTTAAATAANAANAAATLKKSHTAVTTTPKVTNLSGAVATTTTRTAAGAKTTMATASTTTARTTPGSSLPVQFPPLSTIQKQTSPMAMATDSISNSIKRTSSSPFDDNDSGGGGSSGGYNNNSSSIAYERKKQRAKTARVKLNEAIDQLQIAIGLAGSQSKQRAGQFEHHTVPFRLIQDCVATADAAKKWDRPSFVSSAASMIQGLNAQCEALLQALNDERATKNESASTVATVAAATLTAASDSSKNDSAASRVSPTTSAKHTLDESNGCATEGYMADESESSAKRSRLNSTHAIDRVSGTGSLPTTKNVGVGLFEDLNGTASAETVADTTVFTDRNIMDRVASFLEPPSIVRCMRVSKAWKEWGVFSNDLLWQNLAAARFGYFNVRQWQGRLEDAVAAGAEATPSSLLYKTMDACNIMPHFRLDGKLLLGESRLAGKVSAWAFLVERSNGETMRSVQRSPSMTGNGVYASIPVVQLWVVIQNTGSCDDDVVIREQALSVDASTRRRGSQMKEIDWDDRFQKRILNLDGSPFVSRACYTQDATGSRATSSISRHSVPELCRLRLFDSVVIEANIHADGCSTSSKFVQRSNFTQVLIQIRDGTTIPLVIPFPRDALYLLP